MCVCVCVCVSLCVCESFCVPVYVCVVRGVVLRGCVFVVAFVWWCFCGGGVVVLLCLCGGVFCGGVLLSRITEKLRKEC